MNKHAPLTPEMAEVRTASRSMQLYFRHRVNGAIAYRMEVANRQRRIELNQIASISKTGEITPHRRRPPSEAEMAEITAWWADWQSRKAAGTLSEVDGFIADLNRFTDWVQRRADDAEVDQRSDDMLMALLDLRQVIVRRLSNLPEDPLDEPQSDDPSDQARSAEG